MLVIFTASTDLMSAEHTSRFIRPFLLWLAPNISAAAIAAVQFLIRKAAHLTEYAILAALLFRALWFGASQRAFVKVAGKALLLAAFYAALDEFHQSFVASRTASPIDVMIDTCGAALGLGLCWFFARQKTPARAIHK